MKESTQGGGRRRRPPPCVEAARSAASFMDECVAVAVAEAVAVAVTEAVAEADQSIHDQSIHEPTGGLKVDTFLNCFPTTGKRFPTTFWEKHLNQN